MPDKKEFRILRTVQYITTHHAHYRDTIQDLLEMDAPFAWQEISRSHQIDEIKEIKEGGK